jgi:hypothetical protein
MQSEAVNGSKAGMFRDFAFPPSRLVSFIGSVAMVMKHIDLNWKVIVAVAYMTRIFRRLVKG